MTKKIKLLKEFQPGRGYSKEDWDAVDSPEPTEEELRQARPFREAMPDLYETLQRSRGRPRIESPKEAVTLRLDSATIQKFKSKGADWRARMAEALDKAAS
ncbi:BrnA antitoxin family protein [Mesorhizobium sp. J428]|uniref:BrnA antitoxin family protein n=1 Tax=Mesorhizobium sp. J428 TaxID=2898440 RepID=UPI0021506F2A|nr:BrnA antitoxin family protein [Mesorhizobium sp. J428]MCR5857751.1 BrnA antitoxin family protein [Mesorhizobium sp. J428]